MSWRLRHEWRDGATVNGARLATCVHCGTLRAVDERGARFIRRVQNEDERVRTDEPPCLAPREAHKTIPTAQQQAFAFLEGIRTAKHRHIPASAAQVAEALASIVTCRVCEAEVRTDERCQACGAPLG